MSAFLTLSSVKEISRTRRCLWSPGLFSILGLPLASNSCAPRHIGDNPPSVWVVQGPTHVRRFHKTGHVQIEWSVSAIDFIEVPTGLCWLRPPILCLLSSTAEARFLCCFQSRPYWCLKRSCASWFMHLLKGLIKYKFINDAMKRLKPSLVEFHKFQQESKYTWFKSGK